MGKSCLICKNKNSPFFQIPSDPLIRLEWINCLQNCGITNIKDYSVICKNHFEDQCFNYTSKFVHLKHEAVPSLNLINSTNDILPNIPPTPDFFEACTVDNHKHLEQQCKLLTTKLEKLNHKYQNCLLRLQNAKLNKDSKILENVTKICEDAENSDEKAQFLLNIIQNYNKKVPRWCESSICLCTVWRFCSPKGYQFCRKNVINLPSKTTISRFLGKFDGQNQLIKDRLYTEISHLKHPAGRLCSLIIDDMSIKQKMYYSRSEDCIYGLDTCTTSSSIEKRPKIANKLLCFVVHGLSVTFTIPVGYFFHATLRLADFHLLTLEILKLVTDCGLIALRVVTDNISSNVALFKKLSGGSIKNYIEHPYLNQLPLFLSFDYCHALENARNQFLAHDMCSPNGIVSSSHLKFLHDLQKGLPIKPVRFLTKKHLYPSNFEKMNVLRAIQIFSPTITAALKFLKESGNDGFADVDATVFYMETMYHFFTIHNVSHRSQYIRALDDSIAPYVDISDERLHWLEKTFPNYIDAIQQLSTDNGVQGLTKETAHALKFTAQSTSLCVKFLLQQAGFYYVLTRSFSSDAVEATYSLERQSIQLTIIEEDSYEKDVLFYVQLGEPQMSGDDEVASLASEAEKKRPEDRTEQEKVAILGKPRLGEISRAQIRIKESKEFKNTVDKLVQRANASLLIGTSSWKEQFVEALTVSSSSDEEEKVPSCCDYFLHSVTLFWKLIFAFVPPTDIFKGYLCFVVSIICIGLVTAVIGDVASHFGGTLGIEDSVTAIMFVALGTSIPDTFASKVAAIQDKHADASVGNVTGSNAVNVFLGIGVAWSIAAIYHRVHYNAAFYVKPGNLAFSVTIFCSEAAVTIIVLLLRRSRFVGGELGGPTYLKYITSAFLFSLWIFYLVMSTLEVYKVIHGF